MKLYVGWDVGAWNCDNNRQSRDALFALTAEAGKPVPIGKPWRGNVREALCASDVVTALLQLMSLEASCAAELVVAVDTPLAWPIAAIQLLCVGATADVPLQASTNPYLFRSVERHLSNLGKQPLSPIRDMIGSQSLKGMHFLRRANLVPHEQGVWQRVTDEKLVTAIECYPAACKNSASVQQLLSAVAAPADRGDARDAACCAVIAWMFEHRRNLLLSADVSMPESEGWIWTARDAFTPAHQ